MQRLTALTASTFLVVVILMTFNLYAQNAPSMHPLGKDMNTKVTSYFGMKVQPTSKKKVMHKGIDFKVQIGTPIYATADGKVKAVVEGNEGYGNHILIEHDSEYKTKYAHLSKFVVSAGMEVKKGQIIAYSGNSGASTGPHLHYEVLQNEKQVNPVDFF